jgi:hypothetical protein
LPPIASALGSVLPRFITCHDPSLGDSDFGNAILSKLSDRGRPEDHPSTTTAALKDAAQDLGDGGTIHGGRRHPDLFHAPRHVIEVAFNNP